MKLRKTQLAAAVGAALLVGGTAVQAQNLQVQLYGQVNRALMFVDDEVNSKWFHVDGQPSSTRFGIQGTSQIAPGLRAGARIETEIRSNRSNQITMASPTNGSANTFTERWLDATLEGAWGKINLGQGSGAADDASTLDLSGTSITNGSALSDWAGAVLFTATGGGATPDGVINNMDFESRYDRVMYTTPVFGGFRVQAGFGQKDNTGEATEASLWYSGKLAGDFQAAIGWSNVNMSTPAGGQDRETLGGSVSWLHTSGFNLSLNYTTRDLDGVTPNRDATYWFGKVGYKFGQHAISLAYAVGEDQLQASDEATGIALGYVWNPIRWAEFYAGYILYQLDRSDGTSPNDITVANIGTRIRF